MYARQHHNTAQSLPAGTNHLHEQDGQAKIACAKARDTRWHARKPRNGINRLREPKGETSDRWCLEVHTANKRSS